jgi:hypothetical protein
MSPLLRWAALVALTIHGLWVMPGRAFLISDTQIYMPMLDRLADPSLYSREIVAQRQHLSLTLWDEAVLTTHRLTGAEAEQILTVFQAASRLIGLYGLFLIGTALGLGEVSALLVPAILGLGALIHGPAILLFELEAVPRGFAVMFSFLATGWAMHGRSRSAAIAAGLGFLLHAPAVVPFLLVFVLFQIWQRDLYPLLWVAGAIAFTALFAFLQPGIVEKQAFFTAVDPAWEELQRMRASYNWLSSWKPWTLWNCAANGLLASLGLWRIWPHLGVRARAYASLLPAIGLLSLPLAWFVMERMKWALMAQVQPARCILFTVSMGLTVSIAASVFALRERRFLESAVWLLPSLFTPIHGYLWEQFAFPSRDLQMTAVAVAAALGAAWFAQRQESQSGSGLALAHLFLVAVAIATGWLWSTALQKKNFTLPENPELDQAAQWARSNSPKNAMFLLPELVRSGESGVFRVRAQRALYVDWKIGGQVNYSRELSFEWWRRMKLVDSKSRSFDSWAAAEGVDYVVLKASTPFASAAEPAAYRNARYAIYRIRPQSLTTP